MRNPLKPKIAVREVRTSQKPKVFSYRSGDNTRTQGSVNDSRPPNKPLAGKFSKAINYLIVLALFVGVIYMCILKPEAQVKISGEKVYPRDKSSYEQQIDKQLKSSIFYRFKPTFNSSGLSAQIKKEFPEVNEINISLSPLRHKPVFEIGLAEASAKLVTQGKVYVLDDEGRALFEQKDAAKGLDLASLLTINDNSDQQIVLGQPALTKQQIGYIREVIGQTRAKQLKPRLFTLSNGGTAVNVRFDGLDYFVKFNFYANARQSSGALIALQKQLKHGGKQPSEYIDLRIPEKAYVK